MKDVQISVTPNRTIVVRATTERFGKHAIMFEGHTFEECYLYIQCTTKQNHFQLKSLSCVPMFTDTKGRTMPTIQEVVFD